MKDRQVFIAAALESIGLIQSYIAGYDLPGFLADRRTQDAVIRNLEIIGQALKDFGIDELARRSPDVPWRTIAAMRNLLAHEYMGVDAVMVWDTVTGKLGELQSALKPLQSPD